MKKDNLPWGSLAVSAVVEFALLPAAFGQQTDVAGAQGAGGDSLQEIVVTAQKRQERLQDVPAAVSVIGNDTLEQRNIVGFEDFYRSVPGLTVQQGISGFSQVSIRGLTTGGLGGGTGNTPTVGIYLDDIPLNSSTALSIGDSLTPDVDPNDLQQIEVLKGPQGTLYGASTLGGLVKYDTLPPSLTEVSGRVSGEGIATLSHGTGYDARASITFPVIEDELGVRASVFQREDPGYIFNVDGATDNTNSATLTGGLVEALWQVNTGLSVKLTGFLQQRRAYDDSIVEVSAATGQPLYGDLAESAVPGLNHNRQQFQVYSIGIKDELDGVTLSSTTSYGISSHTASVDYSIEVGPVYQFFTQKPVFGTALLENFSTDKLTEEAKIASSTHGPLEWIFGVFYTHEISDYYEDAIAVNADTTPTAGVPALLTGDIPNSYEEWATFGDLTYHLTDRLSVQGGIRYAYNRQTATETTTGLLAPPDASTTSSQGVPTYLFTPSYKLNDQTMLYARFATGFRVGGPNLSIGSATPRTYTADTTDNYEVGIKESLWNGLLYVDADAFDVEWNNIQLKLNNAEGLAYYTNAGEARSRGFELTTQVHPVRGLTGSVTLSYVDAVLTRAFPVGIVGSAGDRLPYSPGLSGSAAIDYTFGLSADWQGFAGGDYSYVGGRLGNFQTSDLLARPYMPAYSVVNLRAGANYRDYQATLYVSNVANERGYVGAEGPYGGVNLFTVIQPRTLGIRIARKF